MLFTSQVGYYFIYTFLQYQVREQVERQILAGLPESSLEVIVEDENKHDIIWEEEGKEFSLKGQLYDVAKIKKVDGKVLIYCLNDAKEEKLLKEMAKAATSSGANNKEKGSKNIFKLHLNAFISDMLEKAFPINLNKAQKYPDFIAAICSSLKKVTSPPPRADHQYL